MLTIEQLKGIKEHTVFADGECKYKDNSIKWVAVRGGIHDWAIYFTTNMGSSLDYIRDYGGKMGDKKLIKQMVLCDKESFEMYRY